MNLSTDSSIDRSPGETVLSSSVRSQAAKEPTDRFEARSTVDRSAFVHRRAKRFVPDVSSSPLASVVRENDAFFARYEAAVDASSEIGTLE